jgi:spore coat protein H
MEKFKCFKSRVLIFIAAQIFCYHAISQVNQSNELVINLTDLNRSIENTINMDLSNKQYQFIQSVTGEKVDIKTNKLIINGDTISPKEINTRGQTSLYFKRKSYNFKLKSDAIFCHKEQKEPLHKFIVLGLTMDKCYTHNRLAFEMMKSVGLFDLFYTFCDLRINGKSEGINMVIERPEDWAMIKKNSPLVLRRGYDHKIEKIKSDKKSEKSEIKLYQNSFNQIYRSLNKYEGEELYKQLSQWIDMDNYMKWIAFNFFVRNGDYSDEVFFYVDPETRKFKIIPWDYDDIFAINPHEGTDKSKKTIGNKMIFSSEDLLDVKIANDPYIYDIYLNTFRELLNNLTSDVLKQAFENTYSELFPYYSNNEIIINSQYDLYKNANLQTLKTDLFTLFMSLNGLRISYLQNLEKQ